MEEAGVDDDEGGEEEPALARGRPGRRPDNVAAHSVRIFSVEPSVFSAVRV
jgi:hypothetical protein